MTVRIVWTYAVALHEDRRPVWNYLVVDYPATGHGIALLETAGNVEAIAGSAGRSATRRRGSRRS